MNKLTQKELIFIFEKIISEIGLPQTFDILNKCVEKRLADFERNIPSFKIVEQENQFYPNDNIIYLTDETKKEL